MLAFLVYQALFAGFFETGIRQTIAMGFVLSSINFVLKKNIVPFVICILIAYTIHSTAIFFVPLLLIHFIREYRKVLLVTLLCSPVLMSFVSTIIGYISQGTVYEGYASQRAGAGTPVFSAFLYLVAILYYWFYPKIQEETEYGGDLLSLAVMFAVLLMPLSWVNPNYLRLTFYFTSFFLAIIPLIVESVTRQIPQIRPPIYIGITILLVCLKFLK